ncbi:hypothetical protein CsatB_016571 [Cannabis sativa]|uniref:uncharacterized protein LOC115709993 isoform X1 n=1 Tax=Cannabis sativa TaxID=3483 RepID=UPI0029CA9C3B|nr:uncharacterized protein LOC115709993 isoform X1 [Cannabis sativa]
MISGSYSGSSSSGCYSASSSSENSSPPAATAAGKLFGGGADRMVEEELEAAEALADLAHLGMRGSCGGGESVGIRSSKGKRVKSQSPPVVFGVDLADSATKCSDLVQQDRKVSHQQHEKVCGNVLTEPWKTEDDHREKNMKVEKDTDLPNTSPIGTSRYSSMGCSKSRRNLTEAEKEARRIRRVLANRESARQTIRRRQALCEELTKKAANLASENDTLKRDMEMALKEYQSLEITNKQLKDQVANVEKKNMEKTPSRHKPACHQLNPPSTSPPNSSLFLYNHPPFTPLFWPPTSQSENFVQPSHMSQNAIVMPSNITFPVEGRHDSCELEDLHTNGPRTPFYVLPCPWFYPHPDQGIAVRSQPSFPQKIGQEESYITNQCNATSSKAIHHIENQHSFLPVKVKTEPSGCGALEARTNDLNEHPADVSQETIDQETGFHASGSKPMVVSTAKHEKEIQRNFTTNKTSADVCHTLSAPPGKSCEPIIYSCKKSVEAVAAAEARKRRKELTKLKSMNGRQCRMHC